MEVAPNEFFVGDSREVLTDVSDCSTHLCVTSPPYNVGMDYGSEYDDRTSVSEWKQLIGDVFEEVYRVLYPDGKLCIVVGGSYDSAEADRYRRISLRQHIQDVFRSIRFEFVDEIIWRRTRYTMQDDSALLGSYPYPSNLPITQQHDSILIFRKPEQSGNSNRNRPEPDSERYEASKLLHSEWKEWTQSVWEIEFSNSDEIEHDAPFPVELALRLVKLYSFVGDVVLDPFVGGGTTAVAAKATNRNYVGIDQNPEYVEYARSRVSGELEDIENNSVAEAYSSNTIPQYIIDGLDRQDSATLREIASHAQHLAVEREQLSLGEIEDEISKNESVESVEYTDTGAIVEKFIPCGKASCSKCPHGPYKYHAYRDGNTVKMDYLGPAKSQ